MNNQPKLEVDRYGNKWWYLNGDFHNEDGPALIYDNGSKHWYLHGERHREDGPAIEYYDGTMFWYLNGKRYYSKEKWFQALTPEQQYSYLWNLDE
jgi:hypothetical protein